MTRDYCVYRYILDNGQIIYVGKTDASLKQRIDAHQKEDKFQPYLGRWSVKYIELANKVETDVVEKFLINSLKPILNEKDCIAGITSMSVTLPNWKPYEKYEESQKGKNRTVLMNTIESAKRDDKFFQNIFDSIVEGKETFLSKTIHPTGLLPLPSGIMRVTELEVENLNGAYLQKIKSGVADEIEMFPNRIRTSIWMSVANLWIFEKEDEKKFGSLCNELDFAEKLKEFKENGFREDCDSERSVLHLETSSVLNRYAPLFSAVRTSGNNSIAEVNEENYDQIPSILEDISRDLLTLFRYAGIIPYHDEDEKQFTSKKGNLQTKK